MIGYGTGVLYLKCKCHFDLQLDGRCSFLRSFHSKCSLDTVLLFVPDNIGDLISGRDSMSVALLLNQLEIMHLTL